VFSVGSVQRSYLKNKSSIVQFWVLSPRWKLATEGSSCEDLACDLKTLIMCNPVSDMLSALRSVRASCHSNNLFQDSTIYAFVTSNLSSSPNQGHWEGSHAHVCLTLWSTILDWMMFKSSGTHCRKHWHFH
jgi:hypothetical protein